jgi:hypothetical protein
MQYRVVLLPSTFISRGSNPQSRWHSSAKILSFPKCRSSLSHSLATADTSSPLRLPRCRLSLAAAAGLFRSLHTAALILSLPARIPSSCHSPPAPATSRSRSLFCAVGLDLRGHVAVALDLLAVVLDLRAAALDFLHCIFVVVALDLRVVTCTRSTKGIGSGCRGWCPPSSSPTLSSSSSPTTVRPHKGFDC